MTDRLPNIAAAVGCVLAVGLFAISIVLFAHNRDDRRPAPVLHPATVARLQAELDTLKAENRRLNRELVVSNEDQRVRLARLENSRANRGTPRGSRGVARRSSSGYTVEQWRPLVARYPWDVNTALAIIRCESGGDPNARNPTSSATGLLQILGGPTDPAANIDLGWSMYNQPARGGGIRGWTPWNESRSCWGV